MASITANHALKSGRAMKPRAALLLYFDVLAEGDRLMVPPKKRLPQAPQTLVVDMRRRRMARR